MAVKKGKKTQRNGNGQKAASINASKKGAAAPAPKKPANAAGDKAVSGAKIEKAVKKAVARAKMPRNYKAAVDAVSKYRAMRAAGEIGKITAMEELSKFVGKKGGVLQKKVKSEKGKREFSAAVEKVKKEIGRRPGKKTLQRYEQKAKGKLEKATKTYVQKQAPDNRFKKKAREAASQYARMVDIFASDDYARLREIGMGIGSDIVEALARMDIEEPELEKYLQQIGETFEDLPPAARGLAAQDEFWQNTMKLIEWAENTDGNLQFTDIFGAYLTSDDVEHFEEALETYAEIGDNAIPFKEIWQELQYSMDPGNVDTMQEIIEEKKQQRGLA